MKYKINDMVRGLCSEKAIIINIENGKYELNWEDGMISKLPINIVDKYFKLIK